MYWNKALVIGVSLIWAVSADAAPFVTLTEVVSGSTSVDVAAGGRFDVKVILTSDASFAGLTYFIDAVGDAHGLFAITDRNTLSGNPLPDPTTAEGEVIATGTLDPRNGRDLGYTNDFSADVAAGTYEMAALEFTVDPGVNIGTFVIRSGSVSVADTNFNDFFATSFPEFTVNVIPTPSTLSALGVGAIALLRRRRDISVQQ